MDEQKVFPVMDASWTFTKEIEFEDGDGFEVSITYDDEPPLEKCDEEDGEITLSISYGDITPERANKAIPELVQLSIETSEKMKELLSTS